MMKIFKLIDATLCNRYPKYKLCRICKAIGIKPYKWQKDFVFDEFPHLIFDYGRGTGKTTAVMLRLLMQHPRAKFCAETVLIADPDFNKDRMRWYGDEYRKLKNKCLAAGIPVIQMELFRMIQRYR